MHLIKKHKNVFKSATFPYEGSVKIASIGASDKLRIFSIVLSDTKDNLYSFFCFPALAASLSWGSMNLTAWNNQSFLFYILTNV